MPDIPTLLADPNVRGWYLAFCLAVMVLPMAALSLWYHGRIRRTAGGRALMDRQNRSRFAGRRSLSGAQRNLGEAASIFRAIASGEYGDDARRLQRTVYRWLALWIMAVALCFGVLIWADEVNRPAPVSGGSPSQSVSFAPSASAIAR